jgi:hypothetical protein
LDYHAQELAYNTFCNWTRGFEWHSFAVVFTTQRLSQVFEGTESMLNIFKAENPTSEYTSKVTSSN